MKDWHEIFASECFKKSVSPCSSRNEERRPAVYSDTRGLEYQSDAGRYGYNFFENALRKSLVIFCMMGVISSSLFGMENPWDPKNAKADSTQQVVNQQRARAATDGAVTCLNREAVSPPKSNDRGNQKSQLSALFFGASTTADNPQASSLGMFSATTTREATSGLISRESDVGDDRDNDDDEQKEINDQQKGEIRFSASNLQKLASQQKVIKSLEEFNSFNRWVKAIKTGEATAPKRELNSQSSEKIISRNSSPDSLSSEAKQIRQQRIEGEENSIQDLTQLLFGNLDDEATGVNSNNNTKADVPMVHNQHASSLSDSTDGCFERKTTTSLKQSLKASPFSSQRVQSSYTDISPAMLAAESAGRLNRNQHRNNQKSDFPQNLLSPNGVDTSRTLPTTEQRLSVVSHGNSMTRSRQGERAYSSNFTRYENFSTSALIVVVALTYEWYVHQCF